MSEVLIIAASPAANGVTDALAREFSRGYASAGGSGEIVKTRDYTVAPCVNCGYCRRHPGKCVFNDDGEKALDAMRAAPLLCVVAPIYFYALPAGFKGLIDRAQTFWRLGEARKPLPCVVILAAGRARGDSLFTGAALTLKYFFRALGREIVASRHLRSLEEPTDVTDLIKEEIFNFGRETGEKIFRPKAAP